MLSIFVSNCKQVKGTIFYLNGEKNDFTYDFRWQRTLFGYTLCCHTEKTISVAQIQAGASENARKYSLNSIYQALFVLCIRGWL